MTSFARNVLLLGALLYGETLLAETVYVTDQLQLGLYRSQDTTGQPTRVMPSGTPLQVLDRVTNFARVRTTDGEEGWVKSWFLVDEEPARGRLTRLEQQNSGLTADLENTRESLAAANERIADLEANAATANERIRGLQALEDENRNLEKRLAAYGASVTLPWLVAAAGIALVLGFATGASWLDRRVRKRFGGVRIY